MIYQSLMWGVYHHNLDIPGGDGPVTLLPHNLVVVEVTNLTNQHDLTPLQHKNSSAASSCVRKMDNVSKENVNITTIHKPHFISYTLFSIFHWIVHPSHFRYYIFPIRLDLRPGIIYHERLSSGAIMSALHTSDMSQH